jgi:hypothetical protein
MTQQILAHGGAADGLLGVGPAVLGAVLIGYFVMLLSSDRVAEKKMKRRNIPDEPSPARQIFDGKYDWSRLMLADDIESSFDPVDRAAMAERASVDEQVPETSPP